MISWYFYKVKRHNLFLGLGIYTLIAKLRGGEVLIILNLKIKYFT
jgi:hypothetical protein